MSDINRVLMDSRMRTRARARKLAGIAAIFLWSHTIEAALIRIDGSSTVYLITEAVAEEFGKIGADKAVIGVSGTGGGFKQFCHGDTDINEASRPISEGEIQTCKAAGIDYMAIPIAYDGIAVVVHPSNTFVDYLTIDELKKMWEPAAQKKITKWSQIRQGWPEKELSLFGPGTDSGTFDYFTEVINGKSKASRGDYSENQDSNVLVEGIISESGALGYIGLGYYTQNKDKLKIVPINNGAQNVTPSVSTVLDGSYKPLSRRLFIYVNQRSLKNKPAVRKFIDFYLANVSTLATEVGYVPLRPNELQEAKAQSKK